MGAQNGNQMEVSGLVAQCMMPRDCVAGHHITCWDAASIDRIRGADRQRFVEMLGGMGEQSCEAQGLRQPLTNIEKMQVAGTRVYIAAQRVESRIMVVGILKMGTKNLFIRV